MTIALSFAALFLAIVHIVADHRRAWVTTWWSKPATMLAIIGLFLTRAEPLDPYASLVLAGLICSLVGDVFLMLRPMRFLAGLIAFFVAHLIYIAAFTTLAPPSAFAAGIVLLVSGAAIYAYLWPGLGRLWLPVMLYVLAIVTMTWSALSAWQSLGTLATAAAAVGALLFLGSDTSLGVARFRWRYPGAQVVTLGTYYAGQWLIALSATALAGA